LKKILIRTPFLILKKSKNIEKFFNSRKKLFKIKIAIQISHPKHNKSVTQNTTNLPNIYILLNIKFIISIPQDALL